MSLPHYVSETQIVRRIAKDPKCKVRFTLHALQEMEADGITAADVQFALINGQVVLHELKKDLLWRVSGTDIDGGPLTVIAAVYEQTIEIKVVTAF